MRRPMLFLTAAALLAPHAATACELWFSPYSHTEHFRYSEFIDRDGKRQKFVNSHPSLGFECVFAPGESAAMGAYRDSYGGESFYVSRQRPIGYGVGYTVGALVGHKYPYGAVPFVGLQYAIQLGDFKASIGYLPSFGIKAPDLGIIQFSTRIF